MIQRGKRSRIARRSSRTRCKSTLAAFAPWFGFNDNGIRFGQISAQENARLTESVGAGIHRLTFDWRYAEPEPGVFHFEAYDEIYNAMIARGVRPLFVVAFAPDWARDRGGLFPCAGDCRYPPAASHYAHWRRITGMVASRYPRAAGIEVWNEPNDRIFWNSGPDPRRYAEVLAQAHRGIKAANPAMPVITGGFSDRGSDDGGIGLESFLSQFYAAGGKGSFDALGFHSYPSGPRLEPLVRAIQQVRAITVARGHPDVPLWVTETGVTTTDSRVGFQVTPEEQATHLRAAVRTLRQEGADVVLVHTLLDPPLSLRERGYGVVGANGTPKPAFCGLAQEVGLWRPPPACRG